MVTYICKALFRQALLIAFAVISAVILEWDITFPLFLFVIGTMLNIAVCVEEKEA